MNYDLRLGLVSTVYTNNVFAPVISLSTRTKSISESSVVVSVGGEHPGLVEVAINSKNPPQILTYFA